MNVTYHSRFEKEYKKLNSGLQNKFNERLTLFMTDEFNPILNNHPLKGKYIGYRSINVSGDIRALYTKTQDRALFVRIASHSKLYS